MCINYYVSKATNRKLLLYLSVASVSIFSTLGFIIPHLTNTRRASNVSFRNQKRYKDDHNRHYTNIVILQESSKDKNDNGNGDKTYYDSSITTFDDDTDTFASATILSNTELWLDLRGSSILPNVAIDYILENLKEDEQADMMVSKVVLSLVDYDKLQAQINTKATANYTYDFDIVIVDENNKELYKVIPSASVKNENEKLNLYGKSFSIDGKTKVVNDLMGAMSMYIDGNWILLNTKDMDKEMDESNSKKDAVHNFIQLMTSMNHKSPLLLDWKIDDDTTNDETDTKVGGIAIECHTNSDLLNTGSTLQSLDDIHYESLAVKESNGVMLFVPTANDDNEWKEDKVNNELKSAIILPMDISLWKSALLLFR